MTDETKQPPGPDNSVDAPLETVEAVVVGGDAPQKKEWRKKIDMDVVETMLKGYSSGADIAAYFAVDRHTLYARVKAEKGIDFGEWLQECQASTRHLLRMTQIKSATGHSYVKTEREYAVDKDGNRKLVKEKTFDMKVPENPALLIFLGKNVLGQSDSPDAASAFGSIPAYRLVGDGEDEESEDGPAALPAGEGDYSNRFNDEEEGDDDDE